MDFNFRNIDRDNNPVGSGSNVPSGYTGESFVSDESFSESEYLRITRDALNSEVGKTNRVMRQTMNAPTSYAQSRTPYRSSLSSDFISVEQISGGPASVEKAGPPPEEAEISSVSSEAVFQSISSEDSADSRASTYVDDISVHESIDSKDETPLMGSMYFDTKSSTKEMSPIRASKVLSQMIKIEFDQILLEKVKKNPNQDSKGRKEITAQISKNNQWLDNAKELVHGISPKTLLESKTSLLNAIDQTIAGIVQEIENAGGEVPMPAPVAGNGKQASANIIQETKSEGGGAPMPAPVAKRKRALNYLTTKVQDAASYLKNKAQMGVKEYTRLDLLFDKLEYYKTKKASIENNFVKDILMNIHE